MQTNLNRRAVGGYMSEDGDTVRLYDAFADVAASLPRGKAIQLLGAFDARWPNADYLDSIRHLIEAA